MTRRGMGVKAVSAIAVVAGVWLALGAAAFAQTTGYQFDGVGNSQLVAGGTVHVHGNGFGAGSTVTVTIESTPLVLGTLVAGGNGAVDGTFTIPATFPTGSHTITLSGFDSSGHPKVLSFQVTVLATSAAAAGSSGLAFTGGNVGLAIACGTALVIVGGSVLASTRRQKTSRH